MKANNNLDDQLLPLSGIQHFNFCRRQWALIHIERQWRDNQSTVEGKLLHHRTDDPFVFETRHGICVSRALPVVSYELGLYGICDVVEFHQSEFGARLHGQEGKFLPMPIEYKRGKPKEDQSDEVQLCAQAICLEEMFSVDINNAAFYYASNRRRHQILLSDQLRLLVKKLSIEMHDYFKRGFTPQVKTKKACKSCSLSEICLPSMLNQHSSVSDYLKKYVNES